MSNKLTWLLISMATLALAVPSSRAADRAEQTRLLQHAAQKALSNLNDVCLEAWKYDNLRPTIARAVWPEGTLFKPPEVPVIHLSPGSPQYRAIVGQMAYWGSLCASLRQRLADRLAERKAGPQGGGALQPKNNESDEDVDEETFRVENERDHAKASYRRACAWAWPYVNLRPMCHQPGFEPDTILNPLIPVPVVGLSPASPDYNEIVTALNCWELRARNGERRVKDLHEDRKRRPQPRPV